MQRLLLTALVVLLASGCLPTRDRVAFGDGDGTTEDSGTPDDDTGGSDDMGGGGDDTGGSDDMGPDPDMNGGGDDACTPQAVEELCAANGAMCGMLGVTDNCGASRTIDCGGCAGSGVGCVQNSCLETNCRDSQDNDQSGDADCDDPNCRGEQCSPSPNKVCQADGSCE